MMKIRDLFFHFVRSALWHRPTDIKELPTGVCLQLLQMARQQTLHGLIADVILRDNMKVGLQGVAQILQSHQQAQASNLKLDEKVEEVTRLLKAENIRFVIVKGQVLNQFYPKPGIRAAGDIDLYCVGDDFEKAIAFFNQFCGEEKDSSASVVKEINYTKDGVVYEVHRWLIDLYAPSHQRYWDSLFLDWDKMIDFVKIGLQEVPTLNPTLNALYVFVHLFYHQLVLGVGLRQFCDLAVLLHHEKQRIDALLLQRHLCRLGLLDAFCTIGAVLVHQLGLPSEDFPVEIKPWHRRYAQRILEDVFKRGNFGHYHRKVHEAGWQHSLETGCVSLSHFFRYFRLAPKELLWFIPKQTVSSIRVNWNSHQDQ